VDGKQLVTIGVVIAGGLAVFVYASKKTTTSSGTDAGSVASQANILAANSNAITAQATEQLGLAKLATSYETAHDSNQTQLALAVNTGATNVQLGTLAANATYQAALLGTAAKIQSTLSTAQTSQYADYVTGQTALATSAATIADTTTNANSADLISSIVATAQQNIAATNATANTTIAQANADAQKAISANATTAAVNQANQAASASKSTSFWGGLSSIVGSVASKFIPSSAASSGASLTDTSNLSGYGTNMVNVSAPNFSSTSYPLPTINWPQFSGNARLPAAA
jgi:hypothetical protein